jgi:hypothetical protein
MPKVFSKSVSLLINLGRVAQQFLKFHIPTQKAVEVADVSFDTRTEWIDKIMSYDPNELHKKIADATK